MRTHFFPRSTIFVCIVACIALLPCGMRADEIDSFINRQMRKQHIPGLSLAVVRDGHVIRAGGYGYANVELKAKASSRTVYGLASMSKQFAAACILLLVQDGKVALDAPVGKYLEGSPDSWKAVSIRSLLTHTSGLPREGMQTTDKTDRADFSRAEIWKAAIALPLQAPPGTRFAYSNLGYNLLAMIVEKVSGKSYGDFLEARIFGPLGMRSSRLNDALTPIPGRACGYVRSGGALRIADHTSPSLYFGAGAIVSTVLDLARWDAALYGNTLLNAESRKQMVALTPLNGGGVAHYGFGWFVDKLGSHTRIAHDGLLAGFRTYIARYVDDRLTVIVLTNLGTLSDPGGIANGVTRTYFPDITDYLADAGTDQPTGSTLDHPASKPKSAHLEALAGRYEYSNNHMLTVEVSRGRLVAHLPGSDGDLYTPISNSVYVCPEEALRLEFLRDARGDVTGIALQDYDGKRTIPRIGPLPHSLTPVPDPDPARTAQALAALKAISAGGKAIQDAKGISPGARTDFASPEADLVGLEAIDYVDERDVADRHLTRHGGKISRVLYYRWKTEKATRYIQVYLTADGLITDEDVVDG